MRVSDTKCPTEGRRGASDPWLTGASLLGVVLALLATAVAASASPPIRAHEQASGSVATAGLPGQEQFVTGQPRFEPCDDEALVEAGATCATVTVPLDHRDPGGPTIEVAISRIAAPDPAIRRGILLFNPGGPGGPGLDFPALLRSTLGEVADHYDLIGFDPRFVGRSTPITCGPTRIASLFRSAGVDRAGFKESARHSADFAERCHERHADVLPFAGTRDVARDMDVIRAALGERRLSYYGVSYGTDVGVAYSQLFSDRVDRMVLDSATAGDAAEYETARARGGPLERALDEWAAWAARHHGEHHLGRTAYEVRLTTARLVDDLARRPVVVDGHVVDDNVLPLLLDVWLNDESNDPVVTDAVSVLVDLAAGQPAPPTPELSEALAALDGEPSPETDSFVAASFAVICNDDRWPSDPNRYWRNVQSSRRTRPFFGPLVNNISPCAFWEDATTEPPPVVGNAVPALIVQAERDVNTPLAGARELHRKLTRSRLVTADVRAHGLYVRRAEGSEPVPCIEDAVHAYLHDGVLPDRDGRCRPGAEAEAVPPPGGNVTASGSTAG